MKDFKIECMQLDPVKKMNFQEFLQFKLNGGNCLRFTDFHKHIGISKPQWDTFRIENQHKKIEWLL